MMQPGEKGLEELDDSSCSFDEDPELKPLTAEVCLATAIWVDVCPTGIDLQCYRVTYSRWIIVASMSLVGLLFEILTFG